MNQLMSKHLTDLQIDDHLIGDLDTQAAAHLAACDACAARIASASAPMAGFQAVTLAWGERRSATMPMQRFASREFSWRQRLAWAASMTAAITVGFAVPLATNQARLNSDQAMMASQSANQTVASVSPDEQIASDNQMLQTIDAEYDTSAETPAALGLVSVTTPAHRSSLQD